VVSVQIERRDVAIAAVAFVLGIGMLVVLSGQPWPPPAVEIGPVLLVSVALAFRRTAPRAALGVGLAAIAIDSVPDGPAIVAPILYSQIIYDACLYGSRTLARWLIRLSAAVTLLAVAAGLIWLDGTNGLLLGFYFGLITLVPALTAMEVRHHREQAQSERLRAEQVARLAELDHRNAVATERTRMARELHDLVANHLSAIAVQSTAALSVRTEQGAAARRALKVIRENSVQGLDEMRRMIGLLRDHDDADPITTAPRLDELQPLLDQAAESGVAATLRVAGEARPLPAAVELAAYRIVQESLTNALKHAAPGRAEVTIDYRPERVAVTVENTLPERDNGSAVPGSGAGLIGMGERAALLDGSFAAGPHERGWRVHVELPIEAP
jgi:signal transduction histidine kinase